MIGLLRNTHSNNPAGKGKKEHGVYIANEFQRVAFIQYYELDVTGPIMIQ